MPACKACHENQGDSNGPRFPILAGQGFDYLQGQLKLFRSGVRRGPLADVMRKSIPGITDEQIRAVALYYAGVAAEP